MEIKKIENTSEGKFLNYSTELFNWSSLLIKEYKMLEED